MYEDSYSESDEEEFFDMDIVPENPVDSQMPFQKRVTSVSLGTNQVTASVQPNILEANTNCYQDGKEHVNVLGMGMNAEYHCVPVQQYQLCGRGRAKSDDSILQQIKPATPGLEITDAGKCNKSEIGYYANKKSDISDLGETKAMVETGTSESQCGWTKSPFDSTVDWEEQISNEQCVVKPKIFKEFKAKARCQTNSNGSANWSEMKLAQKVAEQNVNEMNQILTNIEWMWSDDTRKDKSSLNEYLSTHFSNSVNPFALVVFLIKKVSDTHVPKTTTLAFTVMREFDKWYKCNHRKFRPDSFLSQQLQMGIFKLCTKNHLILFDTAVRCFHLCYPGNDCFLPRIKMFLEKKKFKEAAICASRLGLQHHFDMDQIVLPLILQDKINLLDTYVCGSVEQQQLVVEYLDYLCDRDTKLDIIASSIDVPCVQPGKFKKKLIGKLAARLLKQFNLSMDMCPNIRDSRNMGSLKFLLHKRYIEKGMGSGGFEEMVRATVGDSAYLMEQLVENLAAYNETDEAARWANFYHLDDQVIPQQVRQARQQVASQPLPTTGCVQTSGEDENWEESFYTPEEINTAYHQLSIPLESVVVVDTLDKYNECMACVTKKGSIVGVDSEWRPGFCGQTPRIALLQLAMKGRVFLLDMVTLMKHFTDKMWEKFAEAFFCSQDVLKLGYGIETDLMAIVRTLPCMRAPMFKVKRIVNLEKLAEALAITEVKVAPFYEDEDDDSVPKPVDGDCNEKTTLGFRKSEEKGLSELTRCCLGRPLDKSEQLSDWERRPLRVQQIRYAAIDAYVLLELYDFLEKRAREQSSLIDTEPTISLKWLKPSKNKKKQANLRRDNSKNVLNNLPIRPIPVTGEPGSPKSLRVVVDTMLQGLGKQLRTCGVDVFITDIYDDHERAVEIGRKENRIILTSGFPYQMIVSVVGEDMCYNVTSATIMEQVLEIFTRFNIKVEQQDIFSRCQICNGDEYITIPSQELEHLAENKKRQKFVSEVPSNASIDTKCGSSSRMDVDVEELVRKSENIGIDWWTATVLATGVPIRAEDVPWSMFAKVDTFYCCAKCGKVFWYGSHFDRVKEQFSHVLSFSPGNGTVYDKLNASVTK